jgi:dihydroorotate dehydrogenase
MFLFKLATRIPGINVMIKWLFGTQQNLPIVVAGIEFPNRIGLAAGFDKDGKFIKPLSYLPFGHVELGTVTPRPQDGNPRPRLFRLPKDQALINRMGFNNEGVEALVSRLRIFNNNSSLVIGGNIGKNKDTPLEQATDDYVYCFEMLFDYVDYFTVNVSSPNTPGLRSLQDRQPLEFLLGTITLANDMKENRKPIFLKIAPDLSVDQIDEIIDICRENKIDGIIATNTTIDRSELQTSETEINSIGNGGLSGAPLSDKSTEIIKQIRRKMPRPFAIIGVGGIASATDAQQKLDAGADLVQIYTGFIYQGPRLVKRLVEGVG